MKQGSKEIKYEVDEKTGCHICTSHKPNSNGYPLIQRNGKSQHLHRYIYEQKHGSLSKNLVVRHTCDTSKCINIKHLKVGTQYDNIKDRCKRKRTAKGEKSGKSKLTKQQVIEIKKRLLNYQWGDDIRIAKDYNVDRSCINNIKNGRTWKHLNL